MECALSVETDYQAPDLKGFGGSLLKSIFPTLRFVNGICIDCLAGSNNFFCCCWIRSNANSLSSNEINSIHPVG